MPVFGVSGPSYQALTMQNAFYVLSIVWLFKGGHDHGRTNCQLVCVSQKAFCSSFMVPLTCGKVFLKLSLFLKQLQSYSQLFISAGAEELWPGAGSHLSK